MREADLARPSPLKPLRLGPAPATATLRLIHRERVEDVMDNAVEDVIDNAVEDVMDNALDRWQSRIWTASA